MRDTATTRRRMRARARALAGVAALVVGAGLVPAVLAPAAHAAGTVTAAQEPGTVVPAPARWQPPLETVLTAGTGGYLAENDAQKFRWVNEADGTEGPAVGRPAATLNEGVYGSLEQGSAGTVRLTDYASGAVSTITAPAGQTWLKGFTGDAILTSGTGPDGLSLHVIRAADGGGASGTGTSDTAVSGVPAGAAFPALLAQAGHLAVVRLTADGADHTYLLDLGAATAREIFAGLPAADVHAAVIGGTRVVGYAGNGTTAYSVRLDDPAGTVERTPVPDAALQEARVTTPVPVGDRILFVRPEVGSSYVGLPLLSVPVGGGEVRTLLDHALWTYAVAPDGSVLVTGGSGPEDWAVRRITAAPGADPVLSTVTDVPAIPATVYGLSYSAGRLVYPTNSPYGTTMLSRDVTPGAGPGVSEPAELTNTPPPLSGCETTAGTTPGTTAATTACAHMQGLGTGTVAFMEDKGVVKSPVSVGSSQSAYLETAGASTLADGSGRYVIADTPDIGRQTVLDLAHENTDGVVLTRPVTASAVWGRTLWVPGTTAGTIRPYDLRTRTFGTTVSTSASCGTAFKELQADGRWLYWSCGTSAAVHDLQTGKDIPVPAGTLGDALLGDGYLVRHDAASGALLLTDVHTGAAVTSTLADLPETISADRGVTWSVDKYGGGVAYVDPAQNIHVLPLADLPRPPLGVVDSTVDSGVDLDLAPFTGGAFWDGSWNLSRPSGSWSLTIEDAAGAVVTTRTGGAADRTGARVSVRWDLTTGSGDLARNGTYRWALTAQPADGQGAAATATGTFTVTGTSARRDFDADGRGDLFGMTPAGTLDLRHGTPAGGLALAASGAGWPSSDTLVPFGDLDGDRQDDLLVRDSTGRLWLYSGHGGPTFTPSSPHVLIGSGYQQYDQLVSAGDMNTDGRPDLLGRDASGALWLHAGTEAGGFAARTLVGTGYQQYTLISGGTWFGQSFAGDGQIIARDAYGVLWSHVTDGKGHFQARWEVGSGWNQYDAVVAVGSLAGDGITDILARDARGGLWRFALTNNVTSAPVWEGGGWQMYARLM